MKLQQDIFSSFENVRKVNFGARFYKTDLHFHTPASEDARGRNRYKFNPYKVKYPIQYENSQEYYNKIKEIQEKILVDSRIIAEKMIKRFVDEKLSLVAVTDHNGIGTIWPDHETNKGLMDLAAPTWYEIIDDEAEKVNKQAEKKVLTILPGVEISTTGIHILAIFPPQHPRRKVHFIICDLLNEIGFDIDEWGKNPKVGKASVYNTIELICKKGGIPIIAHVDGSDQALLKLYKLNSGAMKNVFKNKNLSAIEVVNPSKFTKTDRKLKKSIHNWTTSLRKREGLAALAYFQGSDAHDLKSIAKRFTYVKMTEPSFSGFKIAINIPSSRVRISELHKPVVEGLYIYGMEIKNKYFGKRFIRFNRHLNCIAGKKASGKSYVFQLMQKAVNQDLTGVQGDVKLFIEKVIDSMSHYYVCCRDEKSVSIDLYSINKDKKSVTKIDLNQLEDLMIKPKFYKAGKINDLISSKEKLNTFIIKRFGEPTKQNIKDFNKMFSIPNFLESKNEQLLYVESNNDGYKLYVNINWHTGKEKMVEFFQLSNSLRRAAIIYMIIISGKSGPLIIDTPENNFDNEDIVNFLIPIIKKYKDFRQIILFSNNPILSINSDPENYILLNIKGKKLKGISSGFSIDKRDQKNQLINLMEGSLKSFKKRVIRYGS